LIPIHRRYVAQKTYSTPTPSFSLGSIRRQPGLANSAETRPSAATSLPFRHTPTFFTPRQPVCVERAKAQSAEAVQIQDSNRVRVLEFIRANPGTHLR